MTKVYRVFNEVEESITDDEYLEQGAEQYVISILATDDACFYIYADEDSQNLEFASFEPDELEGRITEIVEYRTLNGEDAPVSADQWAELASYNLGRRTFKILAYETEDDVPLSSVEDYEKGAIENYLSTKARRA